MDLQDNFSDIKTGFQKLIPENILQIINRYRLLLLIVMVSFMLRISLRSNYLDDWDSVQFALALKEYSITAHQPHPPGYPLYVLFGRIANYFFNDPAVSLTFISALFGSLSLIPTYLLSEKFFNVRVGIISVIILSLTPAHLLFSEVAMTDIVSMFFITLTVYILYLGIESKKYLYIGSVILGLTLGVRQTDVLLILFLTIVLLYRKKIKDCIISLALLSVTVCLWLVPVILHTGLDNFLAAQKSQWDFNYIDRTFNSYGGSFAFESMNRLFFEGWSNILYIFLLIALIFIVILIINDFDIDYFTDKRVIFIIIWLASYYGFILYFNPLYISRYILPLFPPMSMIFAYSMTRIHGSTQKRTIKALISVIFSISIILMGYQAIAGAYAIHTTMPAPVKQAEFIKKNYDPQNTFITSAYSFRHLQYYLPDFTVRYIDWIVSPDEVYNNFLENKTILSSGVPFIMGDGATYKIYKFSRDRNIYPKHESELLYEIKPNYQGHFIVLRGDGWYSFGNKEGDWIGTDAVLRIYSDKDRATNVSFQAVSFRTPRNLEVRSTNLETVQLNPYNLNLIKIPVELKDGYNVIKFHVVDGCEKPSDINGLQANDNRCLSMLIMSLTLD